MTATAQQLEYLKNSIQSIQDYPKPGILFRDVTSLLEDPKAYALSIELLAERYKDAGITKVVGTEARGLFVAWAVKCTMRPLLLICSIWAASSAWKNWESTAIAWSLSRATKQIPPHSLAD